MSSSAGNAKQLRDNKMNNVQEKDWAEDAWAGHTGMESNSDYCSEDRVIDVEWAREKKEQEMASLPAFEFKYELTAPGTARLLFIYDGVEKVIPALNFSNPLLDLTESAIQLNKATLETSIAFMDETEEHVLHLVPDEEDFLEFEVRWHEQWASWGKISADDYKVVLTGKTTVATFCLEVLAILTDIFKNMGPQQYRKQWLEDEFPENEYKVLHNLMRM